MTFIHKGIPHMVWCKKRVGIFMGDTALTKKNLKISCGSPFPLGAHSVDGGINFAVHFAGKGILTLCVNNGCDFHLDPVKNGTGTVRHIHISGLKEGVTYHYRTEEGLDLLDPYARCLSGTQAWGEEPGALRGYICDESFDWEGVTSPHLEMEELVIYEMHVRGLTMHRSSPSLRKGTYLGVIDAINHLKRLGINAVELLPVHEFNETDYHFNNPETGERLYNYWGYSTVNFFSPMGRYASSSKPGAAVKEFKEMVKALHQAGIELILDVVYNHTAEGDRSYGPGFSFRGLDVDAYYISNDTNDDMNFSGCGNSFNANHPIALKCIVDSLRYWVLEMHVDGFRFDLASLLTRDSDGTPLAKPPVIEAIARDPVLANTKLIAEPWDAGGLYQVGHFPAGDRWSEWNGQYRDCVRRFIKGTPGQTGDFATKMSGSEDLYGERGSAKSVNFITAHDGFSLEDLVSYNGKHNEANGEHNRDGTDDNESWNCGEEGVTSCPSVNRMRKRQMKNFHLALMVSQGVPMILMGDEYGHSKMGNNNTWCHDNDLNWFQWEKLEENAAFFRFYRKLIHFRKTHHVFQQKKFLSSEDICWYNAKGEWVDWDSVCRFLAYVLFDNERGERLYIAFNPRGDKQHVILPEVPKGREWRRIIDTQRRPPHDFVDEEQALSLFRNRLMMMPYSSVLFKMLPEKGW